MPRRKTGGGGPLPNRDASQHSNRLRQELDQAIVIQQQRRRPGSIDPSLIVRVQMTGALLEDQWNQVGLTVLANDEDRTLVLFSSSDELTDFRAKLAAYGHGTQPERKNPAYAAFIANVESIAAISPRDRIGRRAREAGLTEVDDFQTRESYVLDIELWDLGRRDLRERKIDDIVRYAEAREAQELDRHIGPNISMVRLRCAGVVARFLFNIEEIAEIDFPPEPDFIGSDQINLPLGDLPPLTEIDTEAPMIGIIDSGINDHPLIEDIIVGSVSLPASLGSADDHGHGTFVAGVATFGDLRAQLTGRTLQRSARLCSAKVVDHAGRFPENRLVPGLMRQAIEQLHAQFGCRIFVIALGDRTKIVENGKVGPWAQTLDELVRELDVVIIVAAGNRHPRRGLRIEEAVTEYPGYLTENDNRLCEPAGGLNIVTVGAVAHGNGLSAHAADNVGVRPITERFEPSPFTRLGPGAHGAIKPDFIDVGGTLIYDGPTAALHGGELRPEAGVLSLYFRPVDRLFATRSGTSHAAPLVAYKTSQILRRFPDASANLIRTLLVTSATTPEEAVRRMGHLGQEVLRATCGHGRVDAEKASFSDDNRVILFDEGELAIDHFAVYQIPIPEPFQTQRGRRNIRVSLAYNPPVRHSRREYNGVSMGFRLIRGCDPDVIFEHYRRRTVSEGPFPEMGSRFNCKLEPSPTIRERSTLQTAEISFSRDVSTYGDFYYLMVRCASGWSGDIGRQDYAVTVEISHEAEIPLYERLRQRPRVRV